MTDGAGNAGAPVKQQTSRACPQASDEEADPATPRLFRRIIKWGRRSIARRKPALAHDRSRRDGRRSPQCVTEPRPYAVARSGSTSSSSTATSFETPFSCMVTP